MPSLKFIDTHYLVPSHTFTVIFHSYLSPTTSVDGQIMQFKTTTLLLLASVTLAIAQTPGEEFSIDDIINNGISEIVAGATSILGDIKTGATSVIGDIKNGATSILGDIKTGATSVIGDIKNDATSILGDVKTGATSVIGDIQNGATSIAGEVQNYLSGVGNDFETVLPTITAIPSDVDGFFNSVGSKVENLQIPTTAWNDIKTGLYPPQVSQWVDSLPTSIRAKASQKLTEWADDVGNTTSSASRGTVVLVALGAAGVLALAIAL